VKRKHEITLKSSLTSGTSKCHSLPTTFAVELSAVVRKNIRSQELTDIVVAELGVEPLDVDPLHIAVKNEPITIISQIKQDDPRPQRALCAFLGVWVPLAQNQRKK
jgi:hypothetical protein